MSYEPSGTPREVLRLALKLASAAAEAQDAFDNHPSQDDEYGFVPLGEGVEMLRPLWELAAQISATVAPAEERDEWWSNQR